MEIAVTGATGFVGSHLSARLLAGGNRIITLVRDPPARAMGRLTRALHATGVPREVLTSLPQTVLPVQVCLDRPRLGLEDAAFKRLADRLETIWHCAGLVGLDTDPSQLQRANVQGTRQVLALAAAGVHRPHVVHVSTAYVAGARRHGLVGEDDLDASHGFLTAYEESKYRAEKAVHDWVLEAADRRVTILRPSVLVTDRPLPPRAPRHPHAVLGARLNLTARRGAAFGRRFGLHPIGDGRHTLRMPGHVDAALNILPIEYATDAMVRLVRPQDAGVRTFHVVHPTNTPVATLMDAMQEMVPWLHLHLTEQRFDPSPAELYVETLSAGVSRYGGLRRRYARGALDAADDRHGIAPPAPLSGDYLLATLRGGLTATRTVPAATAP
ncbi:SDR family oxidoreductase [Streptomyces sp. NPDC003016]